MRSLTSAVITQLEASAIRPVFLVELQFANENVFVWSGVGNLVWDGNTFQGVGTLGAISPIVETIDTQAQGISLTLSGIPAQFFGDAMNEVTTAGKAVVQFGFLDASGNVVNSPIVAYTGQMDQPQVDVSSDTISITIAVENRLSDLQRARGGRYTDADQRSRHPNDSGLMFINQLSDKFINWHS